MKSSVFMQKPECIDAILSQIMWVYLLQGIGFGFTAAVQPGPFQTYLITPSLSRDWRKTLPAALAPLITDGPIILLCLLVLSRVPAWMERGLFVLSGLFILYLAYGAFRSWQRFQEQARQADSSAPSGIFKAALMNALSPYPYIYWTLVTGPILWRGWRESPVHGIAFLLGFYATIIAGMGAIIILFGTARKLGPPVNRALLGISAIALALFGLYQLWLGIVNA
jgi:threonine/homoserine/homoserine lactone efflux protein